MSNQDFDLNAGNSEFYVDPIYYDYEFKNRTDDVAFYTAKYLEAKSPILELAIGSGRTALKAVSKGADVIGVDLAAREVAHHRRAHAAADARRHRRPSAGDRARRPHSRLPHPWWLRGLFTSASGLGRELLLQWP